jgi:hypothetical protein
MPISSGRRVLLINQALALAIEALGRLPVDKRPEADIADLEEIFHGAGLTSEAVTFYQDHARRWIDLIAARPE